MIKEWFPSDLYKLSRYNPKEWLPFQSSHQKSLEEVYHNSFSLEDNHLLVGWYKGSHLLAICDGEICEQTFFVKNILSVSPDFGFTECLMMLEDIAKSRRLNTIYLPDFSDVSLAKEKLIELGFVKQASPKKGYYYTVTYHTGIVLGGGGARGSYQVGAWHALREIGVEYDLISGTSVGALNGAFMVQGNLEDAENMWSDIATDKILNLSFDESENKTREKLIEGVKILTTSALKENGVDSTPLYHMIQTMIDEEKMFDPNKKTIEFYFITTLAPKMEEVVVSLSDTPKEELSKWLLATSSFYPAMKACEINGQYYVDGGYRNNIPKDVLLKRGATELIVIDVKGPGFIKPVRVPREVTETLVSSKWGLGAVLLFDKERAVWNMQQGYLDAMKAFHVYEGSYYTIDSKNYKKDAMALTKAFLLYLKTSQSVNWLGKKVSVQWIMQHHIQPEVFGVFLLEETAKIFSVDPSKVYSLQELEQELVKSFDEKKEVVDENMLISLGEWVIDYVRQTVPFSEKTVLEYAYHLIDEKSDIVERLFEVSWKQVLQAMFIRFLKERNK